MGRALSVHSEIGRLRRVIVHTPGEEIEKMGPKEAEADLYNDIIPLSVVQGEHSQLKTFLSRVCQVVEIEELLEQALESEDSRSRFVQLLVDTYQVRHRRDELSDLAPRDLAAAVIHGLPARHVLLERYLRGRSFDIPPLPNMYFMRDAAFVYRDAPAVCAMRFDVRYVESLVNRFVFSHHSDFENFPLLLDGSSRREPSFNFEGGDFQVLRKDVVAIGVSERTSARAVDALARAAAERFHEPVTFLAICLPIERATIHLDMAFTMIDEDACLVYAPVILGGGRCRAIRIDAFPGRDCVLHEEDGVLPALKSLGLDLKPVLTGGEDSVFQDREQWMSGANSFAFAPGKIIVYSCNSRTMDALAREGFEIRRAQDFIDGCDPFSYKRLVVGFDGVELARGGGGARCMTLPIEREDR